MMPNRTLQTKLTEQEWALELHSAIGFTVILPGLFTSVAAAEAAIPGAILHILEIVSEDGFRRRID